MATDIEFNVRNGMTVGSNKHLVLDVNGALSGSDITCTTGGILSGGSDLLDVFSSSDVATTVASNSGNWQDTYTAVATTSADWSSTYASVLDTSATWDSTYSSVVATSSNWDLAHGWGDHSSAGYLTSETTTSLALNTNSLDFIDEDGITTSIDLSKYLDEDARAIASGTLNGTTGIVTFTRDDDTTFTLDLGDLLDDTNLVTSVNGSNGVVVLNTDDIVDTNQTNKYITTTKLNNLDSTHASVLATSGNWDNVYTSVLTSSADWETAHGWGNHATQNYLTDYTVTQNDVTQHQNALHVTTTVSNNSADWESAHSWGDHATQNYLTDYTVTQNDVTQHQNALHVTTTVSDNSANWESAHAWGDHAQGGYLASETNTSLILASETDTLTYTDEDGTENTISLAAYAGGGVSSIADATDTAITSPNAGDMLVYVNGSTQQWQNKKDRAALEDMYNYANANFYSEMGYTDGKLTSIDVWVSSSKNTLLFERVLTYNVDDQLTSVVTRDKQGTGGSTRATLTKTLVYDETTGALSSVTRSYS